MITFLAFSAKECWFDSQTWKPLKNMFVDSIRQRKPKLIKQDTRISTNEKASNIS